MVECEIVYLEIEARELQDGDVILDDFLEPHLLVTKKRVKVREHWEMGDSYEISVVSYESKDSGVQVFGKYVGMKIKRFIRKK